jgi:PTH1 family peptidyl-tRNA hydrolase
MLLLVGLGNPGASYIETRHNIGFMSLEAIARRYGIGPWRPHFVGLSCDGMIEGEHVSLLLPGTYMNESGRSVAAAKKFYKLELRNVLVFHDDIERRPGNVKVKTGGGDRGHNGLRSITANVGKEYKRVQIGVGRPEHKHLVESYVLSRFSDAERSWFGALVDAIADNVNFLLRGLDEVFEKEVAFTTKRFT